MYEDLNAKAGREAFAAKDSAAVSAELEKLALAATMEKPLLVAFFSNGSFDGVIGRFAANRRAR